MARLVTFDRSELVKIPFLDSLSIGARTLTTLTFFDNGAWHMWVPTPGGLVPVKGCPIEADYFARSPEKSTDLYFEFLNFMTQRACWADAMRFIDGIRNDVHNLGASLAKLDLFARVAAEHRTSVGRFASTEVEYVFGVCRSLYDLLQRAISTVWQRIELSDRAIEKRTLPDSFAKMVIARGQVEAPEAIQARFHVPAELACFYHRQAPFFQVLRDYRDNAVHHGKDVFVFVTHKGFAVEADFPPFASFGVWSDEHMLENRLASLRPIVASVITRTLEACDDFARCIQAIIRFPPEIAPGFRLFVRGYHNQQLMTMKSVIANCSWWDAPADAVSRAAARDPAKTGRSRTTRCRADGFGDAVV